MGGQVSLLRVSLLRITCLDFALIVNALAVDSVLKHPLRVGSEILAGTMTQRQRPFLRLLLVPSTRSDIFSFTKQKKKGMSYRHSELCIFQRHERLAFKSISRLHATVGELWIRVAGRRATGISLAASPGRGGVLRRNAVLQLRHLFGEHR
jgi:hypothetical protein